MMTPTDRREGNKLIVTAAIFLALSSTAVLLRALAIRIRKATWKNHDYLTALALVRCPSFWTSLHPLLLGRPLRYLPTCTVLSHLLCNHCYCW